MGRDPFGITKEGEVHTISYNGAEKITTRQSEPDGPHRACEALLQLPITLQGFYICSPDAGPQGRNPG